MSFWRDRLPIDEVSEHRLNMALKSLENENIMGLSEVKSLLKRARDFGLFEEFKNAFDSRNHFYKREKINLKEMPNDSVYALATDEMGLSYLNHLKSSVFKAIYQIIEFRCYMTIKKEFDDEDIQNVYFSGIDKRLISLQNNFDETIDVPQPSADFLKKLKNVQYGHSTKKFSKKLLHLKDQYEFTSFGLPKYVHLGLIEEGFIELMAGCSAVNNNRNHITKEDIVIGYKTYIKLLNSDVTKYKTRYVPNNTKHEDEGYLVCDKCHRYYKLQPDESPDDFTDICDCGGHLRFLKTIEDIN